MLAISFGKCLLTSLLLAAYAPKSSSCGCRMTLLRHSHRISCIRIIFISHPRHLKRIVLILTGILPKVLFFYMAHTIMAKLGCAQLSVLIGIVLIKHILLVLLLNHWQTTATPIYWILVCGMIQRILLKRALRPLNKLWRRLLIWLLWVPLHSISIVHHGLSKRILFL